MKEMTLKLAKLLSEGIMTYAATKNMKVVVAVVNSQGRPILAEVMDGAFLLSYEVAMKKAYTCAAVKMSTEELGKSVKAGGALEGLHDDRLIFFGGGEPLVVGGEVIGGLGVSGGTVKEDTDLGKFGVRLFEELIKTMA
ncbi:MAG: heme-binding protein [Clostridia bacterium]|nr:heme-binding protein [Clostridia bacterium]